MFEVEKKFHASTALFEKLKLSLSAYPCRSYQQVDQVFLKNSSSFDDFKPGDPVIRIRSVNNIIELTYKRKNHDNDHMLEIEISVNSAELAEKFITELDFKPITKVSKQRLEYEVDGFKVALDEVDELGKFIELEMVVSTKAEITDAEKAIAKLSQTYGLIIEDEEREKYDSLISKKLRENVPTQ